VKRSEDKIIQIIGRRMSGGATHRHVAAVKWLNPATGNIGDNTVAEIVQWLRKADNRAFVCDGYTITEVIIVEADPPYLRTHADGTPTDNLLNLPAF
jgi:hypothetical protein